MPALTMHWSGGHRRTTRSGWMGRRWSPAILLVVLAIAFSTFAGRVDAATPVPTAYAGIVIAPGDGSVIYAYVPLDAPVTGIELLRRSGVSLVTVGFGALGEGVCQIEATGCDVGPCRASLCQTSDPESPYWRYFQQRSDGTWVAAPLGGSSTRISPGSVDGWAWTAGDAAFPPVTIADVPTLARVGDQPEISHTARYDAAGEFLPPEDVRTVPMGETIAVVGILAGMAAFGLALRVRSRVVR